MSNSPDHLMQATKCMMKAQEREPHVLQECIGRLVSLLELKRRTEEDFMFLDELEERLLDLQVSFISVFSPEI